MSKIKNSIAIGLVLSFLNIFSTFAFEESNFTTQILNTHNQNEIIYLIDDDGNLIKLNRNMEDIISQDLDNLISIIVGGNGFAALTEDNRIISSSEFSLFNNTKVSKIDRNFFLTVNGRVFSYNGKTLKYLSGATNVKDIKALSDSVVILYNKDNTITILGDGNGGISELKLKEDIVDAVVYDENVLLVIKKDGKIIGIGDGYGKISSKVSSIVNAKKFIKEDENLYVVTFDDKAIPLYEKGFKAPEEYLSNVYDITIDKFSNGSGNFYKSYFVDTNGGVTYYIQSDNEISNFNKNKIAYINTFDNVQKVYESGYLTIVLHRDGAITIPYDIDHELNGITGVKEVVLKNQSYVVYLNDGQVITSLENFVLNKIDSPSINSDEEMTMGNYLNKLFANILNRYVGEEEFENLKSSILKSRNNFEKIIKEISLDRKFIMLDESHDDIINNLYDSILNTLPSEGEYTHMKLAIIERMLGENKSKREIIDAILNYIFENPIFKDVYNKITQI